MDNCRENYGVDVGRHMAYRAKNLAIKAVLGEHKKQYPRLRDYAQTIMDTNPGSRVVVTKVTSKPTTKIPHPAPRFHVMFFCINGAREGFMNGRRPFIGVDGCFIKLATSAQILAATGRDGNNNIFPLAFAIVGQEDTTNWCWFLHQLKICLGGEIGKFGPYTIMSDRHKGLLNAVNQVFPNCHQRFCLRHLYANFQNAGFRGKDLKKCMDNASYAYNQNKFNIAMNDLKNENFGEKPIRTVIDDIKDKQMVRWHRNRQKGKAALWEITPHYAEKLEVEKKWDLSGIPCNHAISAINKAKRFPEEYMSKFFNKPFYLSSYEPMIYPIPGEHDWTRTSRPEIEPPTFHVKRGRKKEKRIKGKFEARTGTSQPPTSRSKAAAARPRREARSQPPPYKIYQKINK
ncbi:WD repeat-containing protein 43 [Hordeum vulgare]|nr:WD repeat-containing protein 43 [Hordeum vulgare]